MQKLQLILVVCVFCGGVLFSSQVYGQKTESTPEKADVPVKVIKQMQEQFSLPKGVDKVAQRRMLTLRMQKVLQLGKKAEATYPKATNLYEVHTIMLHAAGYLAMQKKSQVSKQQYQGLARKILTSPNAPVETKLNTEFVVLSRDMFVQKLSSQQMEKKLDALVKKYEKTSTGSKVLVNAVILGYQSQNKQLVNKYLAILKKKYPNDPETKKLLSAIEGLPESGGGATGEIFKAELTTLDGKTISMPKDTKGKIVVIDFWASWCPPCRRLIPHLKKFHAKYAKNPDVMIIGISLDNDAAAMKKYIKDAKIPWSITYTGKGWADPTARKYGINGIPSVWVIGKDGKVVSRDAAGDEDTIVAKLIAKKPATPKKKK